MLLLNEAAAPLSPSILELGVLFMENERVRRIIGGLATETQSAENEQVNEDHLMQDFDVLYAEMRVGGMIEPVSGGEFQIADESLVSQMQSINFQRAREALIAIEAFDSPETVKQELRRQNVANTIGV